MTHACTYEHSFELPAWLPRHQVRRIERSGLVAILAQMRLDGVDPDWSTFRLHVERPRRTGKTVLINTTIAALKGEQ
ncbi:hypothetical protein [Streptomyces sp. RTd22]|uniref:hypothetical protein n=1 Tax=Streptomyces sp. RTd22 TaxID=1841249 RepID=UPI0007C5BB97|nr:hypothetical protein [Streptomyces sp. RTd22]